MTIEEAVNLLTKKHLDNKAKKWIHDPVAYTLYEVWKIADSKETYHPSETVTTQANRIRTMSDEELANFLAWVCYKAYSSWNPHYVTKPEEWLDWLQSEVKP